MTVKTIIVVNDFASVEGGASQVAITSSIALAELGLEVHFFSAVGPIDPRLVQSTVNVRCLDQRDVASEPSILKAAIKGVWNRSAGQGLNEILRNCDPVGTIVHIHGWTKALTASVVRTADKNGFRTLVTLHDYFTACPNGGFFVYPTQSICDVKGMSAGCLFKNCDSRSYSYKTWRVGRQLVQMGLGGIPGKVDAFITISDFSEKILSPYLSGGRKVYRVQNPVNVDSKVELDLGKGDEFLFLGRVSREKGWNLFGEAIKRTNNKGVVIGEGSDLQMMKREYPDLEYKGWLNRESVFEELSKTGCLVFSSLWYETQGLTVLEAASVGVPSIVPTNSSVAEFVEDGVTGLHYRRGDISDLVEKVKLIKNDKGLRNKLARQAYEQFWEKSPLPSEHARRLVDVYNRVLETKI
jgi:glycosyltransferase involved in cell wall biosynthesis